MSICVQPESIKPKRMPLYGIMFLIIFLPLFWFGCGSGGQVKNKPSDAIYSQVPKVLVPGVRILTEEGKRNGVLNHEQVGYDAFKLGYNDIAERYFENALLNIESVYATGERAQQAAKARSLWHQEKTKDYKGEPYERVMAYYYRGLTFLMKNDYENARACFKSGLLQDAFAEEQQNRVDFSLMIFLEGWTSMVIDPNQDYSKIFTEYVKLQKPKNELFKEVNAASAHNRHIFRKPDFTPLDTFIPKPDDNVLFIVETGNGPRKRADGVNHDILKFFRGKNFKEVMAKIQINVPNSSKLPQKVPLIEDIYWQANSRGMRPIDAIKADGVVFKKVTTSLADVSTDIGNILATGGLYGGSSRALDAASAADLVSAGLNLISMAAQVHVDTRYWKNLPDRVSCYTTHLPLGSHQATITFYNKQGQLIPELTQNIEFSINPGKKNFVYVTSQNRIYSQMPKREQKNDRY